MVWAATASVVVAVEVEERPATVVVGVDCGGWRGREVREKEKEKGEEGDLGPTFMCCS